MGEPARDPQPAEPAEPPAGLVCPKCEGSGLAPNRKRFCSSCLGSGELTERQSGWQ